MDVSLSIFHIHRAGDILMQGIPIDNGYPVVLVTLLFLSVEYLGW